MNKIAEKNECAIINVVDEFDYSSQNDVYNEKFRYWRRKKDNPYAFNFEMNRKESVFYDSRGFENRSAADSEKNTISQIMHIVGMAMLMIITIDNLLGKLFIYVLEFLGVNVHTSFFYSSLYGGSVEIVAVVIGCAALRLVVPAIYLHRKLKMPFKVEFMSTVNDSGEIIGAIGAALIVCTISCLPAAYSSETKEIYTYFNNINMDVSVWGQTEFVIYTVFDVVILSIMTEILFRGAVFAALRQFGDMFAVVITTVVMGFLTRDFLEMPAAVLVSVTASVGMLRSGTIITAFFVRIIFKMYQLAIIILEGDTSSNMLIIRNTIMLVVFIIGTIMALSVYCTKGRNRKAYLAGYHSEINPVKRVSLALKTFPFAIIAVICILEAVIGLVL